MCVENKMTNNGPTRVPQGLKFQCRTHIGPIWALCPDSAHMGPILPCLLGVRACLTLIRYAYLTTMNCGRISKVSCACMSNPD